jgi:hypothetical protein
MGSGLAIIHIMRRGYLWGEWDVGAERLDKLLKVVTRIKSELACNPGKIGKS